MKHSLFARSFSKEANDRKFVDETSRAFDEYQTRTYAIGDEVKLANLFNSTHGALAGFVPRNPDYWRWSCLTRPGVEATGIVVVTRKREPVGYAVVGKTGDIWEFSYVRQEGSKVIVEKLIAWATDYAAQVGADYIVLNEFRDDKVVREVCKKLGFAESPSEQMFLSVMDLPSLMLEMLKQNKMKSSVKETFSFNLLNCPSWNNDCFSILVDNNGASLQQKLVDPDVTVTVDLRTLVELIFHSKKNNIINLSLKVQVKPFWKIRRLQELLNSLTTDCVWFTPKADIG